MNTNSGKTYIAHRVRGFGSIENTIDSFKDALHSDVELIEVDIRFSKDGVAFLQHDVRTHKADKNFIFANRNAAYIEERFYRKTKSPITKLEEVLAYFAKHKKDHQRMSIDIKSYGYEKQLIALIEHHDLFDSISIFTWTPQIVFEFHKELVARNKMVPMFFSYLRSDARMGWFYNLFFRNKKEPQKMTKFMRFLFMNQNNYKEDLGLYRTGYTHTFFDKNGLPSDLVAILRDSQGGVCINASLRFGEFMWAKKEELQTVAFGGLFGVHKIKNPKRFKRLLLSEYIDYIFLDAKRGFKHFQK